MALPIKFHEHIQLTSLGIRPATICSANVTMESDKHIVIRETVGDSQQVLIVDMSDPKDPQRHPISADSVAMHPSRKILALKSGKTLQIFDIEKSRVKSHLDMEGVIFWRWINERTIALISKTTVYHWSIGDSSPQKVFDRHTSLAGTQVISYRADSESKWLVVIGIPAKDNRVIGNMELYSTESEVSQPIEGHAACFIKFRSYCNYFCFSVKNEDGGMLHIWRLPADGSRPFDKKAVDVPYTADTVSDFPVSMQASSQHGIVYLVTKHGFVHLYDLESGTRIYSNQISTETVFVTTEYTSTGGIMGVNREGQVLSVSINGFRGNASHMHFDNLIKCANAFGLELEADHLSPLRQVIRSGSQEGDSKLAQALSLEFGNSLVDVKKIIGRLLEVQAVMKGSSKSFMRKEIFEQPDSVRNTMQSRVLPFSDQVVLGGIKEYLKDIKGCRRLIMVACGSSYNSAIAGRQIMEELSGLPVVLELASEFLDRKPPISQGDVCLFISQSGEENDTIMALGYCRDHGALLIGITNTVGSTIYRRSDCGVHINVGLEIGGASTKAYTSQILALLMFALCVSDGRLAVQQRRFEIINALNKLPDQIKEVLLLDFQILDVAKDLYEEKSLLIMGRGFNFATCLEGALKIKELSYIHCEGIMSGELKHGPLAMVGKNQRICMIVASDSVYKKSLNALSQVTARGGAPIIIADESVPEKDLGKVGAILRIPKTVDCVQSILSVIPLQLLASHIAKLNNLDVDRPRELGNSVTVE